jgi:hypothetical protein
MGVYQLARYFDGPPGGVNPWGDGGTDAGASSTTVQTVVKQVCLPVPMASLRLVSDFEPTLSALCSLPGSSSVIELANVPGSDMCPAD